MATSVAYSALTVAATYVGYRLAEAVNNRISMDRSTNEYLNDIENDEDPGQDRGGQPPNNHQNPQFRAATGEVERRLGRTLSQREIRQFHDHVTGQRYSYHEMIQEGYWLFYRH